MPNLDGHLGKSTIRPSGIYSYPDTITVWLRRDLTNSERAFFDANCAGHFDLRRNGEWVRVNRKLVHIWHPDPAYCRRLQLYQPNTAALERLAALDDVRLTGVDVALDWVFDSEEERDAAYEALCLRHVKLNHSGHHVAFVGDGGTTRYSNQRHAPNNLAAYSDKICRVTGEVYCLHNEWRIKGNRALCRAGIRSPRDLLGIDFQAFWIKRLLLRDVDVVRLGRAHQNWANGTKRKRHSRSRPSGFHYDKDRRTGGLLKRAYGSTQNLIDAFGCRFDLRRCLVPIDVAHLLPVQDIPL
ncbi:MAG: hypothetical protein AB7O60_03635 [Variibacter sp.]